MFAVLVALPNQGMRLVLAPIGDRPVAVLRGVFLDVGEHPPVAFVRLTPALQRGAAATHNRSADDGRLVPASVAIACRTVGGEVTGHGS